MSSPADHKDLFGGNSAPDHSADDTGINVARRFLDQMASPADGVATESSAPGDSPDNADVPILLQQPSLIPPLQRDFFIAEQLPEELLQIQLPDIDYADMMAGSAIRIDNAPPEPAAAEDDATVAWSGLPDEADELTDIDYAPEQIQERQIAYGAPYDPATVDLSLDGYHLDDVASPDVEEQRAASEQLVSNDEVTVNAAAVFAREADIDSEYLDDLEDLEDLAAVDIRLEDDLEEFTAQAEQPAVDSRSRIYGSLLATALCLVALLTIATGLRPFYLSYNGINASVDDGFSVHNAVGSLADVLLLGGSTLIDYSDTLLAGLHDLFNTADVSEGEEEAVSGNVTQAYNDADSGADNPAITNSAAAEDSAIAATAGGAVESAAAVDKDSAVIDGVDSQANNGAVAEGSAVAATVNESGTADNGTAGAAVEEKPDELDAIAVDDNVEVLLAATNETFTDDLLQRAVQGTALQEEEEELAQLPRGATDQPLRSDIAMTESSADNSAADAAAALPWWHPTSVWRHSEPPVVLSVENSELPLRGVEEGVAGKVAPFAQAAAELPGFARLLGLDVLKPVSLNQPADHALQGVL